jgi:hypothetical protein
MKKHSSFPDGKRKKWLADPISEETALQQLLDWGIVHLVEQSRSGKGSQRGHWRRFGLCPVRETLHEMIGYDC